MPKPTLAACMIVRNEGAYLKACLNSIKDYIDELIIVDTGSTDNTIEIAKSFKATVAKFKWVEDFSKARNASISIAKSDWILVIDADEVIAKKDMDKMRNLIQTTSADGFEILQRNYTDDTTLHGWRPCDEYEECQGPGFFISPICRIFKNNKAYHFINRVHEEIDTSIIKTGGKVERSGVPIHHYGYLKGDLTVQRKREWYLEMGLEQAKNHPDDPKPVYEVGKIYLHNKDYQKAEDCFRKVIALDPDYKIVHTNLGETLFKQDKVKESIGAYKESIKRVPRNENAYINLGYVTYTQGLYDASIELFKRAIEVNPSSAAAYNNLVLTLMKLKRYAEVVDTLDRAIQVTGLDKFKKVLEKIEAQFPDDVRVQHLIRDKMWDQAQEQLKKTLEEKPDDPITLTNLGLVYSKMGEPKKIIEAFKDAIERNQEKDDPLWINMRLNLANAYDEIDDKKAAIAVLKETIALDPPKIAILKNRLKELEEE